MASWSGLFDGTYGAAYATQFSRVGANTYVVNRLVRRMGNNKLVELLDTLIGAAAGSTALRTHAQITSPSYSYERGGKRTIETVTDINRASTAADVTALKDIFNNLGRLTLVADRGGNSIIGAPGYW